MDKTHIPLFKVFMSPHAPEKVKKVLESGFIGQGPKVDEFEDKLKDFFNNDYVATVNAATSAEHLALHMLKKPAKNVVSAHGVAFHESSWPGLEDGDEVLATPLQRLLNTISKTIGNTISILERLITTRTIIQTIRTMSIGMGDNVKQI